ncbi:MAG TPA: hypothetical protein VK809_11315 [Bacteroidia bacterium]|jgi:hypothetical protein|nr:hypothetical protein [Bacteroidia bacterium]
MNFEECKKNLESHVNNSREMQKINNTLTKYDWAYIHPLMLGAEIKYFEKLSNENILNKETIFTFFTLRFRNYRRIAFDIDAYMKVSLSLNPFCHLIDQSIALCIQRDYAGAINTLLPVIEGSMRNYLEKRKTKFPKGKLFNTFFSCIEEESLKIYRKSYNGSNRYLPKLNNDQIEELVILEKEFINIWLSIITNYFSKDLYINKPKRDNVLNRHSIFHGLNPDIYYNFENYLKVFHSIYFLIWCFSMVGECPTLSNLDVKLINYKWKAFEKLHFISFYTYDIKASIYAPYNELDKKQFEIEKKRKFPFGCSRKYSLEKNLRLIDRCFDKIEKMPSVV